eukprot:3207997-Rhodomonas_salina.1
MPNAVARSEIKCYKVPCWYRAYWACGCVHLISPWMDPDLFETPQHSFVIVRLGIFDIQVGG